MRKASGLGRLLVGLEGEPSAQSVLGLSGLWRLIRWLPRGGLHPPGPHLHGGNGNTER